MQFTSSRRRNTNIPMPISANRMEVNIRTYYKMKIIHALAGISDLQSIAENKTPPELQPFQARRARIAAIPALCKQWPGCVVRMN